MGLRELLQRARLILNGTEKVYHFLFGAYEYRINQAIEGRAHAGPLSTEQAEFLQLMNELAKPTSRDDKRAQEESYFRFAMERLLEYSRILEPDQQLTAYRRYDTSNDLERTLASLGDVHDRKVVVKIVQELLNRSETTNNVSDRADILRRFGSSSSCW